MLLKPRYEPPELTALSYLHTRMNLPLKEKQYLLHLKKGFEGEVKFDRQLMNFSNNWLVLNDLLLEFHNTLFQIDTLLISQETVYFFEIKNYEGDFYIEDDIWFLKSKTEIKNPLLQLERSKSLLRRFLQQCHCNLEVKAYLIFMNPEFTLYHAQLDLPIIFPTQLHRFLNNLGKISSNLDHQHFELAKLILSKHIDKSPYSLLPNYDFHMLKKGITCASCHNFLTTKKERIFVCDVCGAPESIKSAILRNIEQFSVLFPREKITTNTIHAWCHVINSKKMIQRILTTEFKCVGHGKNAYYVKKIDI